MTVPQRAANSRQPPVDALLDAVGSPAAAVGLGVTAMVLLGMKIYLAKGNAGGAACGQLIELGQRVSASSPIQRPSARDET